MTSSITRRPSKMFLRTLAFVFTAFLAFQAPPLLPRASATPVKPKLVVVIVIDQFRADYLTRFEDRFLPLHTKNGVGGYRFLMTEGAYYPLAQYDLLQSMTGPGHATVLTGAFPYQDGVPVNDWYDQKLHDRVYCAEDRSVRVIGVKEKPHAGSSPKNLIAPTFGDTLKLAGYPSRVVSLALKDRAAIFMGGQRPDLALWYDPGTMQWTSSFYYLPDGKLPGWVKRLNQEVQHHKGEKYHWDIAGPGSGLTSEMRLPKAAAERFRQYPGFPRTTSYGNWASLATPLGLALTETAAEKAIDAFKLGQSKATDVLAVGFSSHDYAGHIFGPNSREMEEMTVAEDAVISKLLNRIRSKLPGGLKRVLVVLTADHGIPSAPSWLKAHGFRAGRLTDSELARKVSERLEGKYGKPAKGGWVPFCHDLNIYLNHPAVAEKHLALSEVQAEAKAAVADLDGVAHVFTSAEYSARKLPPGMHERQILHSYFPGRSGDVLIIPRPYYIGGGEEDTASHMTGYSYDRSVPLVLFGPSFVKAGTYSEKALVNDIAPTLSFLTGIVPPALSEGRVLSEALLPVKR